MATISRIASLSAYLRKLKRQFGVASPQLSVRLRFPWHIRWALGAAFLLTVGGAIDWAYESGKRSVLGSHPESGAETRQLQQLNAEKDEELIRLRSLITAAESELEVEHSAQKLLSEQNAALMAENAKLKEEVAVFGRLTEAGGSTAVSGSDDVKVDRLLVRRTALQLYEFSFRITINTRQRDQERAFDVQLSLADAAGGTVAEAASESAQKGVVFSRRIKLKNARRIEGSFSKPAGVSAASVQLGVFEAGKKVASLSVKL